LTQPVIERKPFAAAMRAVLDLGNGKEKTYPQEENSESQQTSAQEQSHSPTEGLRESEEICPQASLPQHPNH
jgi:hypothetical protein